MSHKLIYFFVTCLLITLFSTTASASTNKDEKVARKKDRTAIVLACFGTTVPTAVSSIINIQQKIKEAFPGIPVKITFTSNIIRSVWKKRQSEAQKWLRQGIPEEVLYAKNFIATIGNLLEDGYKDIIVQSGHIYCMEQAHDLKWYVRGLASIKTLKTKWNPFGKLVMGRPALGMPGDLYSYHDDLEKGLETLKSDVELARKQGAALVYMAHGNEHLSTGIYCEAQKKMRQLYPDVQTYFGSVEGFPALEDVVIAMNHCKSKKVILKPFMIVAGDHATNDMASDEDDSWKSVLSKAGFKVIPVLHGLGENDAFARIFADHIRDCARDNNITLIGN
ncbi:MAG: sirohydrochlorin cobaltochelatase [Pseudomonadota bacterium]|nr:sirohydrochlorin cobaltochelatase [Pseudomonadota bacterium]